MGADLDSSSSSSVFRIRFRTGTPVRGYVEMQGESELRIGPDAIEIRGLARRLFRRGRDITIRIPMLEIVNVAHADGLLQFDVMAGERRQRLVFSAGNAAAAEQIAARLPGRQTRQFRQALTESRDFRDRLLRVSPTARVTPVLIGLNVMVFLGMVLAGAGIISLEPEIHVRWGSNFGPRTLAGEWWRLGTSMFVHFGILHLLLNMWVLRLYGDVAERLFGSAHFLALYLLSGIAGSLTSLWWHPQVNSAGASGALFGVFGGMLAFVAQRRTRVPVTIMVAHRNSMLLFLGYNLLFGFIYPGIDNAAHMGGLVAGFLLGLGLARPVDAAYRKQHRAKALVSVVITSSVLLVLAALGIARQNVVRLDGEHFREDLAWFDQHEPAKSAALTDLIARLREHKIGTRDFLDQLEGNILPFWDEAVQRFGKPVNSASRYTALHLVLQDDVVSRRTMVQNLVTGFRLEGRELEAANVELEKGNALVPRLSQLRTALDTR